MLGWHPSAFHVNVLVCTKIWVVNGGRRFKCTFISGYNERNGREEMWRDMRRLTINDDPWIILGDFNAILSIDDRLGQPVRAREIEDMKTCMAHCHMMEVKVCGQFFTWNNKQEGSDRVFCKLDRVLENEGWINAWPHTEVTVLPEGEFDHCPLVVRSFVNESRKKPLRFFNISCQADQFRNIVRQCWQHTIHGTKMYKVVGN